jgi:hypothetical protein
MPLQRSFLQALLAERLTSSLRCVTFRKSHTQILYILITSIIQTKGLDWVDTEKAKHEGKKRAEEMYDQHYGDQENYNPEYPSHRYIEEEGNRHEHHRHHHYREDE